MEELAERGLARRSGQWVRLEEQQLAQAWELWASAAMRCLQQGRQAVVVDRVAVAAGLTALRHPTRLRRTIRPEGNERR